MKFTIVFRAEKDRTLLSHVINIIETDLEYEYCPFPSLEVLRFETEKIHLTLQGFEGIVILPQNTIEFLNIIRDALQSDFLVPQLVVLYVVESEKFALAANGDNPSNPLTKEELCWWINRTYNVTPNIIKLENFERKQLKEEIGMSLDINVLAELMEKYKSHKISEGKLEELNELIKKLEDPFRISLELDGSGRERISNETKGGDTRVKAEMEGAERRLDGERSVTETVEELIKKAEAEEDIVTKEIARLKSGYLNFECDNRMTIGRKEKVVAEIFRDTKLLDTVNKDNVEEIKVSTTMKVKLKGDDFKIDPLNNSESLIISPTGKTIWTWNVTPLSSGSRELLLCVTAELKINGSKEFRDYDIIEKVIQVQVDRLYSSKKFVEKNWQWMVATVFGSGLVFSVLKALGVIK